MVLVYICLQSWVIMFGQMWVNIHHHGVYAYYLTKNDVCWQVQIHVAQKCLIRKVVVGYTSHIPATYQPHTYFDGLMYVFFLFLYRTNKKMYRNPKHPNIVHQSEMSQYIHVREMYNKIDKLWWGTLHSYGFSPTTNKTVIDSRDGYVILYVFVDSFCCILENIYHPSLTWSLYCITTMAAWGWRGWPIASVDWDKAGIVFETGFGWWESSGCETRRCKIYWVGIW